VPKEALVGRELLEDLAAKGRGNPLFVEEYLRSLQESGGIELRDGAVLYRREVAEISVPKTLRGIVAMELGRLSATERSVLQAASSWAKCSLPSRGSARRRPVWLPRSA
jgi:predicted ATPase